MYEVRFPAERAARWLAWGAVFAALLAIVLHAVSGALASSLWDDGYMFSRYAHNVLFHGVIAWNASEPAYGLTSLVQLLLVIPLVAVGLNPAAAAMGGSILGLVAFLCTVPLLVRSATPYASRVTKLVCVAAAFSFLALAAYPLSMLALSGMDTLFAAALLSLYLSLALHMSRALENASRSRIAALGVFGGTLYLARPDLIIFSLAVPLSLALLSARPRERARGAHMFGVTAFSLACILLGLWAYFGTPLPLTFYAKSTGLYGPSIWKIFSLQPVLQLIAYVDAYKFLFLALFALMLVGWRFAFRRGPHAAVLGMLAAAAVSLAYYFFFVLQVMGYLSRFYYPTLPALLVAGSIALAYVLEHFEGSDTHIRSFWSAAVAGILLTTLFSPLGWGMQRAAYAWKTQRTAIAATWTTGYEAWRGQFLQQDFGGTLPCLGTLSLLPDDVSLATTEVGLPGALAPEHYLLDLAGLNSTELSLQRSEAGEVIQRGNIDVVYLPTKEYYPELWRRIVSSPLFASGAYEMYSRGEEHFADVALRKESPYASQLRACLQKVPGMHRVSVDPDMRETPDATGTLYVTLPYPLK